MLVELKKGVTQFKRAGAMASSNDLNNFHSVTKEI